MQSGGERYGMGTADMQGYVPPASGTGTGAGGNAARGLAHLFGHPAQASGGADLTSLHTLQLHRPSTSSFQQVAAEQQYLEQLSTHQHQLVLRGNAAQQVGNPFLHAGLQAHHSMASFFKAAGAGGMSGHHEAPDTISSHSFFNMAPGQDQFKLSGYGNNSQQQQQQQLGNQEDETSAAWRSDETAALLKLCSDVDPSTSKAPTVWDDVARKLQEMGYQRSPQRCKEKFESFHTTYKKGKEENHRRELEFSSDFSSEGGHAGNVLEGGHAANLQTSDNNNDDDEDIIEEDNNHNENSKKRKMNSSFAPSKSFFQRLTREIIEKQEELHRAFLETIERKDRERVMREEAHRRQEAARLDREQDLRAQEVSIAASRDAALIAFLEKATGQSLSNTMPKIAGFPAHVVSPLSSTPGSASTAHAATLAAALFQQQQQHQPSSDQSLLHHQALQDASDMDNSSDMNTKRWPKVEVHALIRLRSGMEPRFREAGPKAHLWQEISASMACLGFIRSPKRCKEKWENINKYFKKTKDSSKKRPENAKTCPYFHQLDTLYQRGILTSSSAGNGGKLLGKSDNLLEYNTQDDEDGFNMQNEESMQGEREGNLGEMQNAEQQARDKEIHTDQVSKLDMLQNSLFVSSVYNGNISNQSSAGGAASMHRQMDKFLHHHAAASALNMNASTKKSLQVEMFVKDILDLQQQQHQKLVEEYDRMEQAHELRELERQQIKTTPTPLSHGNTHDSATLMALVHKLAGDSSDLSMSAPSSME